MGLTCGANTYRMCALTESGKIRCFNNNNKQLPQFSDGDIAAEEGKFVYISMNNVAGTMSLAGIRDDGVVEIWGEALKRNGDDADDVAAGLVSEWHTNLKGDKGYRIRKGHGTNKIIDFSSGMDTGCDIAFLESDGSVHFYGNHEANLEKYWAMLEEEFGETSQHGIQILQGAYYFGVIQNDGRIFVTAYSSEPKQHIISALDGAKFIGGCNAVYTFCGVTDDGRIQCQTPNTSEQEWHDNRGWETSWNMANIPYDKRPSNGGKFVECAAGIRHVCGATEDGTIECFGFIGTDTELKLPGTQEAVTKAIEAEIGENDISISAVLYWGMVLSPIVVAMLGFFIGYREKNNTGKYEPLTSEMTSYGVARPTDNGLTYQRE